MGLKLEAEILDLRRVMNVWLRANDWNMEKTIFQEPMVSVSG